MERLQWLKRRGVVVGGANAVIRVLALDNGFARISAPGGARPCSRGVGRAASPRANLASVALQATRSTCDGCNPSFVDWQTVPLQALKAKALQAVRSPNTQPGKGSVPQIDSAQSLRILWLRCSLRGVPQLANQ